MSSTPAPCARDLCTTDNDSLCLIPLSEALVKRSQRSDSRAVGRQAQNGESLTSQKGQQCHESEFDALRLSRRIGCLGCRIKCGILRRTMLVHCSWRELARLYIRSIDLGGRVGFTVIQTRYSVDCDIATAIGCACQFIHIHAPYAPLLRR